MTYRQIHNLFLTELNTFYSKNELGAFWSHCLDFIFKVSRNFFILNAHSEASEEHELKIKEAIARLKTHEPLQYISGIAWFCNHEFIVSPAVLIPRPETEELVYRICEEINPGPVQVLDIGTGSGCIAVSIKKLKPTCLLTAIDVSADALDIAKQNSLNIIGKDSIRFEQMDVLSPEFSSKFSSRFDIIVSNPPYITDGEKDNMAVNVLNFEPHQALFCGDDPLLFYRTIAINSKQLLNPGGLLYFEINERIGEEIKKLLIAEGFIEVEVYKDLQSKDRMTKSVFKP